VTAIVVALGLALQAALAPAPDTAEYHLQRARADEQKRDYQRAVLEVRRALQLRPDSIEAHSLLGEALLAGGYSAEAIPHLERARRLDLLGIAFTEEHRTAQAVEALLAALQKKPDDPELLFYLGKASGFLSKQSFDRVVSASPESARAHQLLAESYLAQQQIAGAEREYRKALELRPDLRGIHLALGLLALHEGNLDEAEKEFRAEVKLSPGDGEAAWRLGSVLLEKGRTPEALVELERSDKLRPQMVETLYDLGKASALENRLDAAEKAWLEVIALQDAGELAASAHLQLSQLYRKQGKLAEADRHLARYRELEKNNGPK
jgi:Flp pilus assembly protein TadD